ncbi:MAG: sulfatase-like hydrolase/transferase [Bacteroidales bacterium]
MKQTTILLIFLLSIITGCKREQGKDKSGQPLRPNILIIFTDDQGYADLGCFGSTKNLTPRMDQMASEGSMFTSFYAQAVCGPSRSVLLTGRYRSLSKGWAMPPEEITFAELIKEVGYQTACIGKWDVSSREAIIDMMPNAQGFDYYFGPLGANDHGPTEGVPIHQNNHAIDTIYDMSVFTRLYTDKAIEYMQKKRDPEKPFVLYLAHTMMHTIIDASLAFRGTSEGGLYGDVVEEFDFETGRLLDSLETMGLSNSTLVIYTTDNGPWCQPSYTMQKEGHPKGAVFWGDPGPFRAGKGSVYEGGMRVPCIVRWPGKVPSNRVSDAIFATLDFMPTFARLTGYEIPSDRVIDGIDQTDLLLGKSEQGSRDHFVYEYSTGKVGAIRKGKWKLLFPGRKPEKTHLWVRDYGTNNYELYDLESDPSEENNLVEKYPNIVEEIKEMAEIHRKNHRY